MKLWLKILLLNSFIVITLGLLIAFGIKEGVTFSLRQEIVRQGELIAKNLSSAIGDYILLEDEYKVQDMLDELIKTEGDIEYIFVTDERGSIFAHTFTNGYPPDLLEWNPLGDKKISVQLLDTEKGLIRDIGLRIFDGMSSEVHVGLREARITSSLVQLRNFILFITVIVMICGAFISFILSNFIIIKPLKRVVLFTHDLSRGEFGKKIEVKSNDEIGELSETFNILSSELAAYKKKMEESYKQMLRTEKLTALGRLSAGLAHELRNPLTSIRTLFQTFRENPSLTKEDIEIVLTAVDQMNDLLTKFLRFARSDEFSISDVYLNSVIKQVINLTQFQLKEQSIEVDLKLSKIPPIKVDRAMIQQALLNLVINAIEAMPRGGRLTISSHLEDGHAIVSVIDTGTGIPDEIRDRIFDPFFTTKSEGTGLGLSIVYNIVNLHGGDVTFESNRDGTTFTIKIPLKSNI